MNDQVGFTETEENIGEQAVRAMREAEDSHKAMIAEYAEDARALLMTCRHLMTGLEIDTCENATGDHDDDASIDASVIDRLRNQFAREIAAWKDGVRA